MYVSKGTRFGTAVFIMLLAAIPLFDRYVNPVTDFFRLNSSLEFSFLIMMWILTVRWRIPDKKTRHILETSGILMGFYMILRVSRYTVIVDEVIGRNLWYWYYVPMLFLALACFYLAAEVDKEKSGLSDHVKAVLFIVTLIIAAVIVSNDYHHLAFAFEGNAKEPNYEYGVAYYAAVMWIMVLYITSVVILKRNVHHISQLKTILVLLCPVILGLILSFLSAVSNGFFSIFKMPESYCFGLLGFLESTIQLGIVPSNSGYSELFRISSLQATIYDSEGNSVYSSENFSEKNDEDTLKQSFPVFGGYVIYSEDISEINRINEALQETADSLEDEQASLIAENKLKEEKLKIDEKNKLYDRIARAVSFQTGRIVDLSAQAEKCPDLCKTNLMLITFYGAFIKRRANLELLASENKEISAGELLISAREVYSYLSANGINVSVTGDAKGVVDSHLALMCADSIQRMTDSVLDCLKGLIFSITETDSKIKIKLAFETEKEPEMIFDSNIFECSLFREDEIYYVTFLMPKGGAAV